MSADAAHEWYINVRALRTPRLEVLQDGDGEAMRVGQLESSYVFWFINKAINNSTF